MLSTEQVRSQANYLVSNCSRLGRRDLRMWIQSLTVRMQAAQHQAGHEMTRVQDDQVLGDMTGLSLEDARHLVRKEAVRALNILDGLLGQNTAVVV